jgi:hypothetical protein
VVVLAVENHLIDIKVVAVVQVDCVQQLEQLVGVVLLELLYLSQQLLIQSLLALVVLVVQQLVLVEAIQHYQPLHQLAVAVAVMPVK